MNHFFRTFGGKLLLFIVCLLSVCLLLGSVLGAVILVGADFYTRDRETIYGDLMWGELEAVGHEILLGAPSFQNSVLPDQGNVEFAVYNELDCLVAISERAKEANRTDFPYAYTYRVYQNDFHEVCAIYSGYEPEQDMPKAWSMRTYTVRLAVTEQFPKLDRFFLADRLIHLGYALRFWIYAIGVGALILSILCFIALMRISARRPGSDALHPGPLHRVPFDLLLALIFLAALGYIWVIDSLYLNWEIAFFVAGLFPLAPVALGLCMSISARWKDHSLLRNTLIYKVLRLVWRFVRLMLRGVAKIPLVWRTALILAGLAVLELIFIAGLDDGEEIFVFFLILNLLLIPAVLYLALGLRRLQKGGQALAAGDLQYQTDTRGLFWEFKRHGENLNSIALGMNAAVAARTQSEHMKTALITNVTHDLKTPLTSIVNYADLIAAEPCENEKIVEYAQVLTRQSERLRRLIDDLVEASKASTGNLEVVLAPCDAAVLVTQAAGEYAQRLEQAGLRLITKTPDEPVRILADGRRMWRIFDNLMGNICKYAQSGTRVYLSLEVMADSAVITFKNTSRQELNITEAELMERFVRGDDARSTEGNGLGLSIARSLAELQNGTLRLFIDGDLFKAILVFPKI